MTDIIHELRGNAFPAGQAYINLCERAADEIEKLRGEVESWKHSYKLLDERRVQVEAERDALKAAAEKGAEYVLAQINQDLRDDYAASRRYADELRTERDAARVERDAAVKLLREINERLIYKGRGSTHWEGCEESHPDCAMAKRIEAVLDAARGEK